MIYSLSLQDDTFMIKFIHQIKGDDVRQEGDHYVNGIAKVDEQNAR